ncbi:biofilm development regulator YmgB/AriR family protein [Cronobacter sakazakii]
MAPSVSADSQLVDYFAANGDQYLCEKVIISEIRLELTAKKNSVTNKDIILALIYRLQVEHNEAKKDILRNALEIVVQRTPDDIQL